MASQEKGRRFRPRPLATLIAVVFTALFTSLGLWQLGRAQGKEALAATFEARRVLPPLDIAVHRVDIAEDRYRDASARGTFEKDHQIYVDNVVKEGHPGYEVFAPLRLDDGTPVLIDRGWVAQPAVRGDLPPVPLPAGAQVVSGWLDHPRSLPVIIAGDISGDETLWPHLDMDALSTRIGAPLPRYVIHAASDQESGLRQKAPEFDAKTGMHIGYAIQWLAFAAAAAGTYIAVNLRKAA